MPFKEPLEGPGFATTFHEEPFQCSIRGKSPETEPPRHWWERALQQHSGDCSGLGLMLGTTLQSLEAAEALAAPDVQSKTANKGIMIERSLYVFR